MSQPLLQLLPNKSLVADVFRRIEEAERLIRARFPVEEPPGIFSLLMPSAEFQSRPFELYAAHARELVDRVADGKALDLATDAEVLLALSAQSLKAPLNRDGHLVMETLFARILPGRVDTASPPESYPGHLEELLGEMRRRLVVRGRRRVQVSARSSPSADAA